MLSSTIFQELKAHEGTGEKKKILSGFFKSGKGQYGEGDLFLGVTVPQQRSLAKKFFREASFGDIEILLRNTYHESRLTALFLLVYKFERADEEKRKEIFHFYRDHLFAVNNWDLVDTTAPNIIGEYLFLKRKERTLLYDFAKSQNLWERRIAILSTFAFLKKNDFEDTLKISEMLLDDRHDLIHKAVGWMLREVGKRNEAVLISFLDEFSIKMPRTMLRYAIERCDEQTRKKYIKKP